MLNEFTNKIVEGLIESELIAKEDIDIYHLGVESALLKLLHFTTMLLIGLYFGMALETIAFIILYSTLRVYAGGFHAKSKLGCYCISWIMIISVLLMAKFCPSQITIALSIGIFVPSYFVIYLLAPVENINKPLDDTEILHYRKTARFILLAYAGILVTLLFTNFVKFLFILSLSLFSLAIMLILGKIEISKSSKLNI